MLVSYRPLALLPERDVFSRRVAHGGRDVTVTILREEEVSNLLQPGREVGDFVAIRSDVAMVGAARGLDLGVRVARI